MTQTFWEPFITVRAVQPVVAAIESLGYDADKMLAICGIARPILDDADGRIPHRAMMQFWQEALTITADDHLGIHLAEAAPIDALGVHAYAALSSPTLSEAYRRACRYQRLIHEATDLQYDEEGDEGVLHHALPGGRSVPRHPAEFLVTLWVRLGRLVTGDDWSPLLVCFAHDAPPDTAEYERVFHAPIQFASGRTAIHVDNQILAAPNRRADLGLIRVLDDYAERLLEQMPRDATLSERVRHQLMADLKGGVPTAEEIAQELHMSVRSLHRNLKQEGVTFRQLLSQLRHERAATYLADPQVSIAEVAFLLGFNELSSFYRAFKRWTGTTPAEFRAAALPRSSSLPL
jgi:AraC-like DNA-binding protein